MRHSLHRIGVLLVIAVTAAAASTSTAASRDNCIKPLDLVAKQFLAEARGQFVAEDHAAVVSIRVNADLSGKYSDGRSLKVQLLGGPGE